MQPYALAKEMSPIIIVELAVAAIVFVSLFFIRAPYGRHFRQSWGPSIPNLSGWIIMEVPAALVFAACFFLGSITKSLPMMLFFLLWELHYVQRAFIYPLTLRGNGKMIPIAVVLMGFLFNSLNAFVNGYYLFSLSGGYSRDWIRDPRFLFGVFLFLTGFLINRWSDGILRGLRKPEETGYRIPFGGLFRWVSCPNYLGEILEWAGWALATWSLTGLAFAIWTFANLAPRAISNHAWYRANFAEYPAERKALIPWIW